MFQFGPVLDLTVDSYQFVVYIVLTYVVCVCVLFDLPDGVCGVLVCGGDPHGHSVVLAPYAHHCPHHQIPQTVLEALPNQQQHLQFKSHNTACYLFSIFVLKCTIILNELNAKTEHKKVRLWQEKRNMLSL